MENALQSWAERHWQQPVRISDVNDLGGHSGKTLGFRVITDDGIDAALVIRIAPPGVARRGSTDVLRQAPLLEELRAQGVRVAAVTVAEQDEGLFGAPFIIVERLMGRPLIMGPDAGPSWLPSEDRQRAYELAAEQLAAIHAVRLTPRLQSWSEPQSLASEINAWNDILQRCRESEWIHMGAPIYARLSATTPDDPTIGLIHGDYQTNNILFSGQGQTLRVTGVVDWELAGIGATELDIAWFLMMHDAEAWDPIELRGNLDLEAIRTTYEKAAGHAVKHLSWYWALACFRMATIAALNIRLHRTGRKPDAAWERCKTSVPKLFGRATRLLGV